MKSIDLNADMGESFGRWQLGRDSELMDYVSSVNVACGFHAGDPTVMRRTIETAIGKGLKIGAHPSFPDLQGFGRREMRMSAAEVEDIVLFQVAAARGVCEASGGKLNHVKPHGALYNLAARDAVTARAIAHAVRAVDPDLYLYGLSGSLLISESAAAGLQTVSEVFADRTYQSDGSLTPRTRTDALIAEPSRAIEQVIRMIESSSVVSTDGEIVLIVAETVCLHGDGSDAVDFARSIRSALESRGIRIG